MTLSLEAVGLTKRYGSLTALSALDLKIEGPKCVGFLGPNGAGKTTTLKMFTDLIRPSSGKALINGVDVHAEKKKALQPCAALIETPEIYPALTAREALNMIAEVRGVPKDGRRKGIDEALGKVKMEAWSDKKVGEFSKGMKQRVCVASTLLGDPDVIILDEPTTGLDPRGMSEVRDIVKSLKGKLVFMSSHLLAEVTDVCQEVAMVDHGKLLVYDTIGNVTAKFSGQGGAVEAAFSREIGKETQAKVASIPGVKSVQAADTQHLVMRLEGGKAAQEQVLSKLAVMGLGLVSFKETATGLEEAYLNLIKETL
jgi:ABC-2 type transport system ATP-binding protein